MEYIKSTAPPDLSTIVNDVSAIVQSSESHIDNNYKVSSWELIGNIKILSSVPVPPPDSDQSAMDSSSPSTFSWLFEHFGGSASKQTASPSGSCPLCSIAHDAKTNSPPPSSTIRSDSRTNSGVSDYEPTDKVYSFPASPAHPIAWSILEEAVNRASLLPHHERSI